MAAAIQPRSMKMALVGDVNVGKTSLARMFIDGTFQARYQASVGLHFHTKTLRDPSVTIQLWDTAGTERYRSLLPHYTRDAVCAILVYDISSRDSFDNVRSYWLDFVESHAIPNMVKFLVGNKVDVDTREVSDYEGQVFATNHDTFFIETSAKFGINVDNLFTEAVLTAAGSPGQVPCVPMPYDRGGGAWTGARCSHAKRRPCFLRPLFTDNTTKARL